MVALLKAHVAALRPLVSVQRHDDLAPDVPARNVMRRRLAHVVSGAVDVAGVPVLAGVGGPRRRASAVFAVAAPDAVGPRWVRAVVIGMAAVTAGFVV